MLYSRYIREGLSYPLPLRVEWNPNLTPAIVDIQKYISNIKQHYQQQQENKFIQLHTVHNLLITTF